MIIHHKKDNNVSTQNFGDIYVNKNVKYIYWSPKVSQERYQNDYANHA